MEDRKIEIVVPDHKEKERLDTFLTREIKSVSRSRIQRLIQDGFITVSGGKQKSNYLIRPSDKIAVLLPKSHPHEILPEDIPLEIIFEDEFILIINKKAGMVVHPAYGHRTGTMVHALLGYCSHLSKVNEPYRPGIVHRLDKDTSGLLVVAKTDHVHHELAKQFQKKTIIREYQALVWGKFQKNKGVIETYLSRSLKDRRKIIVAAQGKFAITHYNILERYRFITFLNLRLETGRTHQIRVHLSYHGHPVFGDQTYGGRTRQLNDLNRADATYAIELLSLISRQALHAKTIGFIHPVTRENLLFESELPQDISQVLSRLREE
jgi:23S rRNA pseudouridine1911/1915/1917 synthase